MSDSQGGDLLPSRARAPGGTGLLARLIGAEVLCCALPMLVQQLLGAGSPWPFVRHWWYAGHSAADSWWPMGNAMAYAQAHPNAAGLYQFAYFQTNQQFIYSPQGLALFLLIRRWLGVDLGDAGAANALSWYVLPALMLALGAMLALIGRDGGWADRQAGLRRALLALAAGLGTVLFYPLTKGFSLGQVQNWLTLLMALSLIAWMRGRGVASGVLLGLAALVKPHVGVLLLFAAWRREWGFCAGVLGTVAVATAVSVAMLGWQVHVEYLQLLHYLSARGESFYASHSFESTLYRLIRDGNNLAWDGRHTSITYVPWVHGLATALGLAVLAATILWRPAAGAGPAARFADFGGALLATVLASPVAYEHHYGILYALAPGAVLALMMQARRVSAGLAAALLVGYALAAGFFVFTDAAAYTPFNPVQSYRLYGALLVWAVLCWLRRGQVGPYQRGTAGVTSELD